MLILELDLLFGCAQAKAASPLGKESKEIEYETVPLHQGSLRGNKGKNKWVESQLLNPPPRSSIPVTCYPYC